MTMEQPVATENDEFIGVVSSLPLDMPKLVSLALHLEKCTSFQYLA